MNDLNFGFLRTRHVMFFFRRINPRWLVFSIDLGISLFSITIAFLLRYNFRIDESYYWSFSIALLLVLIVRAVSFFISGVHTGIIRFSSAKDTVRIMSVIFSGSLFLVLFNFAYTFFTGKNYIVPVSVIIIDFISAVNLLVLFRVIVKLIYKEYSRAGNERINVIICGSKDLAVLAKKAIESDLEYRFKVIAFLGTSSFSHGMKLEGITVYPVEELEKIIDKFDASYLLFASTKLKTEFGIKITETCLNKQVKVLTVGSVQSWINGDLSIKSIHKLNFDDLLNREPIILDDGSTDNYLYGKTILVTGAAGSIGSEIVRQLDKFSVNRVILVDQAETPMYNIEIELLELCKKKRFYYIIGDVTAKDKMERIFREFKPDIVYHAAAYKHVPMMENNPLEAVHTNVLGTKNIADLADKYRVKKFIFISTDKAVNPTNIMGASKRIAEMYVQALNKHSETSYITTRFGNVLGSNGSAILLFKKQIENGGPITITHPEVTRFFMTIPEACQLVLEAGTMGNGGDILIFDMGNSFKIVDLARNMIRLSGLEPDVDIKLKYIGLRPGEKLYEELLHQSEDNIPTHHPKIMIAKVREQELITVIKNLENLALSIANQDELELVKQMKKIVTEFISRNSEFEKLDEKVVSDNLPFMSKS